jgi:hypothetical protein
MKTGSYAMDLNAKLRIISMNSMHFSKLNKPSNDPTAAENVLAWVEEQLKLTQERNMKAIIMYHMPHGIFITPQGSERFWIEAHENKYRTLLLKYHSVISALMTGHTHMSYLDYLSATEMARNAVESLAYLAWQTTRTPESALYYSNMIVSRAVSPIYLNNPGLGLFYYVDNYDYLDSYDEYTFLTLNSHNKTDDASKFWVHLYNSRKDMAIKDLSAKNISEFLQSLILDPIKLLRYLLFKLGEPVNTAVFGDTLLSLAKATCASFSLTPEAAALCSRKLLHYLPHPL